MATARSNIPHGSILAQLRQRQMDEYQAAEEKKQKKAAFTSQMIQLGSMAAGAALAIPTGGLSLAPMMMGAGIGSTAGGLLGNAVTGTPTSMGQATSSLMSIGNLANQTSRTDNLNTQNAPAQPYSAGNPASMMQNPNYVAPMNVGQRFQGMSDATQLGTRNMMGLTDPVANMQVASNNYFDGLKGAAGEGVTMKKVWTDTDSRTGQQWDITQKEDGSKVSKSNYGGVETTVNTPGQSQNRLAAVQALTAAGKPITEANIEWYLSQIGGI